MKTFIFRTKLLSDKKVAREIEVLENTNLYKLAGAIVDAYDLDFSAKSRTDFVLILNGNTNFLRTYRMWNKPAPVALKRPKSAEFGVPPATRCFFSLITATIGVLLLNL